MNFLGGWIVAGAMLFATTLQAETVRVRLKKAVKDIQVSGFGLEITPALSGDKQGSLIDVRNYKISMIQTKKGPAFLVDDGKEKRRIQHSQLFLHGEMLRMDALPQKGDLRIYRSGAETFDVVSEMNIETYLEGVLPAEMPASWPRQAMLAQAIASRSYMISLMKQRQKKHYDLDASVVDQAFQVFSETEIDTKRIKQIVQESKDKILVDEKGKVLRSFYHADCGGQTEEARYVWGDSPIRGTVKDSSCPLSPWSSWQVTIPKTTLKEKLIAHLNLSQDDKLKTVLISSRSPSGRVQTVDAIFSSGTYHLAAQKLREVAGFNIVKSTQFDSRWFGNDWQLKGRGYGHGVGLCQWGAKHLALDGATYEQILEHYYPNASLKVAKTSTVAGKLPKTKQQQPLSRAL